MPSARRALSLAPLSRVAVLAALTVGLLGTTTGIAAADTTTPPPSGSSTASDPTPTDPGSTPPVTDPTGTTDPTSSTEPATTPAADPTITFTLPKATSHKRYRPSAGVRRHRWYVHAVHSVENVVRRQIGKPYVYGADGPRAFDCSGLVRFVFGHAIGRWLPHNAAAQYDVVQHIKRRQLEPGDLVFQESGGYPFHVGIYAGHDKWWHAPHSGDHVRRQTIYRGHLFYGRVLTRRLATART